VKKVSWELPMALQASCHAANGLTGDLQRSLPSGFDTEQSLRSPASLRRRIARRRTDVPFLFQSLQSSIDGADRQVSPRALSDFTQHEQPIGASIQTRQGEKNDVFERPEKFATSHFFGNIKQMTRSSQGALDKRVPVSIQVEAKGYEKWFRA